MRTVKDAKALEDLVRGRPSTILPPAKEPAESSPHGAALLKALENNTAVVAQVAGAVKSLQKEEAADRTEKDPLEEWEVTDIKRDREGRLAGFRLRQLR